MNHMYKISFLFLFEFVYLSTSKDVSIDEFGSLVPASLWWWMWVN